MPGLQGPVMIWGPSSGGGQREELSSRLLEDLIHSVWVVCKGSRDETPSFSLSLLQSGMIRTQEADYFLKPLPSHLAGSPNDSTGGRPPSHILYKRSTEPLAMGPHRVAMMEKKWGLENHHLFHHEDQSPHGFSFRHPQKQHFCGRRKKCM